MLKNDTIIILEQRAASTTIMSVSEKFPNSFFVDNSNIIAFNCRTIITNPKAESKNKEIIEIKVYIKKILIKMIKTYFELIF